MSFSQKCKNLITKLRGKTEKPRNAETDSELSADEVLEESIFPNGDNSSKKFHTKEKKTDSTSENKNGKVCGKAPVKPTSKKGASRPTNKKYEMIDKDGDTCDAGRS